MPTRFLWAFLASTAVLSAQSPAISPGGVVGAGLSNPSQGTLSPGAIFSIFGTNFAASGTSAVAVLVNGGLPTTLGHVCVNVNGTPAPLFAVYPNQINAQVPTAVSGLTALITVTTACDSSAPLISAPAYALLEAASPEFFYSQLSAAGDNPIAATDAASNVLVGPGGNALPFATAPANPGDIVVAYATGLGLTTPAIAAGQLPTSGATLASPYTIYLAGVPLDPSDVLYAGVAPGFAGLYQLNFRIPSTAPPGPQPVTISVAGNPSPASAILYIGSGGCSLPMIANFSANPSVLSAAGPTQVSWAVEGATSIATQPPLGPSADSTSLTAIVTATSTYQLTATNACGSVSQSLSIGVGTPAVAQFQDPGGNPVTTAYVGDTVRLNLKNAGDLSTISGVVLTAPDGLPYNFPLVSDILGRPSFLVTALPEIGIGAPVSFEVSLLLSNGQQTPMAQTLNVALPTYLGDPVKDFGAFINQFANVYTGAIANLGPLANGATTSTLSQAVMTSLQPLITLGQQLATASNAQLPLVQAGGPSSQTSVTVTAQDLGVFLAVLQRVSAPSDALAAGGSMEARPADSTGCPGIQQQVPLIPICQSLFDALNRIGNVGKLLSAFGSVAEMGAVVAKLYTAEQLGLALTAATPAAEIGSILGITAALGNAYCYSQPIFLQRMSFQPNGIPLTFGTANPTPTTVDVKATLGAELGNTLAQATDALLTLAGMGLNDGLQQYLPLASELRNAQIGAIKTGYEGTSQALTKLFEEVFPDFQPSTSAPSYTVGYCAGDLLQPVDFRLPSLEDAGSQGGKQSGMNDFFLFGRQPGNPQVKIKGKTHNFILGKGLPCGQIDKSTFECLATLSVGTAKSLTVGNATIVQVDQTSGCVSNSAPSAAVTMASPYSQVVTNPGYGTASVRVDQIDDSTWHIVLANEEFGFTGRGGTRGCTAVTFDANVVNPPNSTNTQSMIVTVNPASSTNQQCLITDAIGTSPPGGPLMTIVPGSTTILMPVNGSVPTAQINASAHVAAGNYNMPCIVDFTVQLTGNGSCNIGSTVNSCSAH